MCIILSQTLGGAMAPVGPLPSSTDGATYWLDKLSHEACSSLKKTLVTHKNNSVPKCSPSSRMHFPRVSSRNEKIVWNTTTQQVFEWAGWTSVTSLFSRENGNTGPKYLLKPNLTLPQIRKREGRGENGRRSFPSADCAYIRFRPISRRIGRGPL